MLAWLLDAIASGLSRLYGRPLGHDVAIVFLVAFVFTIIVAARWSRFGSSGVTAAVSAPLMSPSGAMRLLATASAVLRGASPAKGSALAILALVVAWLINLFPLAVGASLRAQGENARAAGHERGQPVLGDLVRALDELLVALARLEADAADQVRHERAIALEGRAVP